MRNKNSGRTTFNLTVLQMIDAVIRQVYARMYEQQWKRDNVEEILLAKALNNARLIPFYRNRIGDVKIDPSTAVDVLRTVPTLDRFTYMDNADEINSLPVDPSGGRVHKSATNGSTGTALWYRMNQRAGIVDSIASLLEADAHKRDFTYRSLGIQTQHEQQEFDSWGLPFTALRKTGPAAELNCRVPVDKQIDWIMQWREPSYLLTYPSNLREISYRILERGLAPTHIKQLRTLGETVVDETRDIVQRAFGASIADIYSTREAGVIAFQCEMGTYHVPPDVGYVECLDDNDNPVGVGEIGRVITTPLQNDATPLIRYDLGDLARVGTCTCGRVGLAFSTILGRRRHMLTYPDGSTARPTFFVKHWMDVVPLVRQVQLIQHTPTEITVHYYASAPLTDHERKTLTEKLHQQLWHPFELTYVHHDQPIYQSSHKWEDFISHCSR